MPLFGVVHLRLLGVVIAAAVTLTSLCRHKRVSLRLLRLVLGYGLAINELTWWVFRYAHEGVHRTNLPLQLCDLTVWATVAACITCVPLAIEFSYFTGVAGSGMALLTPDLWSPWPSYPAVYFFLAHGGIVVACSVLVFGRIAGIRPGAIRRIFGLLAAYAVVVGIFNAFAGANYMYLCQKPGNPSLLDFLGPWPVYLLGGAAVALVLFWLLGLSVRLTTPELKKTFPAHLSLALCELAAELRCRIDRWLCAATGFSLPRERMVREQLVCHGIRNTEILNAMRATPRHLFIPAELRFLAYGDFPVPIGYGATISQPFIVALMTELLEPAKAQHVLEVGTGSGYQAAILAQLVSSVDTIEIVPELARLARQTLHTLRYSNVTVQERDGYGGLPERAPFDRIIVTAAPPLIPRTLIDQLEAGGRLVAPVGATWSQELVLLEKRLDGTIGCCAVLPVAFVPMVRSAA